MKFFKSKALILLVSFILLFAIGCAKKETTSTNNEENKAATITLATTTSTQDTGLLDQLVPEFEKKYNIKVKVIAVGTGEAIKLGEKGDADVLLVHSKKAEEEFVSGGFGLERIKVMHNDFVIVGPANDPAKIKGLTSIDAFKKLAAANKFVFISRGDDSGTDKKEKSIWEKAQISPKGDWYISIGQGMGATLTMANEKQAYTLSDRGTYLAKRDKFKLDILAEGDKDLLNPYSVIAVSPQKYPQIHNAEANKFIEFITSAEVQKEIGEFGKAKFGQALFVPDANK